MINKEKAICGFIVCSEHGLLNGEDCHGHYEYTDNLDEIIKANDYSKQCPYNGCQTGCIKTLVEDVLAILKELRPVNKEIEGGGTSWWYTCEECHGAVDQSDHFCKHCGRPFIS